VQPDARGGRRWEWTAAPDLAAGSGVRYVHAQIWSIVLAVALVLVAAGYPIERLPLGQGDAPPDSRSTTDASSGGQAAPSTADARRGPGAATRTGCVPPPNYQETLLLCAGARTIARSGSRFDRAGPGIDKRVASYALSEVKKSHRLQPEARCVRHTAQETVSTIRTECSEMVTKVE
jgi:hypothetical protein